MTRAQEPGAGGYRCPVCSGGDVAFYTEVDAHGYVRCGGCSFVWDPVIDDPDANIDDFCREEAAGYYDTTVELGGSYAEEVQRIVERGFSGRFLDFGGGSGLTARAAADAGFEAHLLEVSPVGRRIATERLGLERVHESLEQLDPSILFDVVVLQHVIEHLPCPGEHLRRLRARMRPGGLLVLTQPNMALLFHPAWRALFKAGKSLGLLMVQPLGGGHVNGFTPQNLAPLLQQAGFSRVSREVPLASGAILARLGLPRGMARIMVRLLHASDVSPSFTLYARR